MLHVSESSSSEVACYNAGHKKVDFISMHKCSCATVALLAIGLAGISQGQDIQSSPTASQTITQPSGTSLNIQGNVGIGMTNATVPLQISIPFAGGVTTPLQMWVPSNSDPTQYGLTLSQSGSGAGVDFRFSQLNGGSLWPGLTISAGLVGVNIDLGSYPQDTFAVKGGVTLDQGDANDGTNTFTSPTWPYHSNGLRFGDNTGEGIGSARVEGSVNYNGLDFYTAYTKRLSITQAGNVGIGTTTPGADLTSLSSPPSAGTPILEVAGDIALSQMINAAGGGSIIFSDGTIQSTAYIGTTCPTGGDYAESVDVLGDRAQYEPGDVMVISSDASSDVTKSTEPYSTSVLGIYSTKPGVVGRRQLSDPKLAVKEIPMAMVGIVPTKVSAENGSIHRGDLLVTSSIAGHAMRGTDRSRMIGAVVGKALGDLSSGTGVIEVAVSLQ
jgi:hypothetical protein